MLCRLSVTKSLIASLVASLTAFVAISIIGVSQSAAANCDGTSKSTHELNDCFEIELKTADAELNAAYRKALAEVSKTGAEPPYDAKSFEAAVRKSQRAWVAWRDAECEGVMPMFWTGGTATRAAVLGCQIEKTTARTKELTDKFAPE